MTTMASTDMPTSTSGLISLEQQLEMRLYKKRGVAISRGKGSHVWDAEGKEYLDFTSGIGIAILGHAHRGVSKAISIQARTIMTCTESMANPQRATFEKRLVEKFSAALGGTPAKIFLCNSGTEANEAALKLAVAKTGRAGLVAAVHGFHGRTLGGLALTHKPAYRERFLGMIPKVKFVEAGKEEELEAAMASDTAAVFLEVVQGEGGVVPISKEYLQRARRLCDKNGALLVFDEVQTGCGRTGRFFAFEQAGVKPDAITLAKGIGGGVPLGVMLAKADAVAFRPSEHGTTFGGNPLACAAGNAVLDALENEKLAEKAGTTGKWLMKKLNRMKARHPAVVSIRGRGLMIGLVLNEKAEPVMMKAQEKGLLLLTAGENVLRMLPPLNTPKKDFERALRILDEALPE